MICINAKYVDGRKEEEKAAKGLREIVYKDSRVVRRSRDFVCVMLTPTSSTADYGELGNLGVEGKIVSPQHIFVNSAGTKVLLRREYWSWGSGEKAVDKLLELMGKAEERSGKPGATPGKAAEGGNAPAEGEARTSWIAGMLAQVKGNAEVREDALKALIRADKDGDCTGPLIALLSENKKNVDLLWPLIRALGVDGLEAAALPISGFLTHKDVTIRGVAAVSLEYIGSQEKKVVSALMKAAGKQKDEMLANHMYRALGRCGRGDSKVRSLLLKASASGKSEFATYGPTIGLAYFEGDAKAARGVEQILKLVGIPGGGRGGGQNIVKRSVVAWTLASIADKKSAKFVRQELIAKLENIQAFWVAPLRGFYETVARVCDGEESELANVAIGVRATVGFASGGFGGRGGGDRPTLMDDSRTGRENGNFTPKGDNLLGSAGGD
jgi:hypothetical protein